FDFPQDMDLVYAAGDPILSAFGIGESFLLPYLEPYLMRSMRAAMDFVGDEKVRQEMALFCKQEGNHFKQHMEVNRTLRERSKNPAALAAMERELEAEYRHWSETRPLKWNLAYAEGFEAFTAASSIVTLESGVLENNAHPMARLYDWHLMEELEHRTVTFDAYKHAGGGYVFRSRVGMYAQWHFLSRAWRMGRLFLVEDASLPPEYQTPEFLRQRSRMRRRDLLKTLAGALRTHLPWYTPHKLQLPLKFGDAQARYASD
ncbi:MAG: metal-dependent hydrolase, partial [Pseudomonadota bacterium]